MHLSNMFCSYGNFIYVFCIQTGPFTIRVEILHHLVASHVRISRQHHDEHFFSIHVIITGRNSLRELQVCNYQTVPSTCPVVPQSLLPWAVH